MNVLVLLAAVVVGTWNGNWFPSGRAEHRAHPDVEDATIMAAAKMLRQGLDAVDPSGRDDVILVLNEMRGPKAASNLIARIGRPGLRLVSISGYRRRDRFDMQQDAIATTLPVVDSGWWKWSQAGRETPPRGYSYASVVVEPAVTARVCAVHLKSNYGATTPELKQQNIVKRTRAVTELLSREKCPYVIVAGDMNADRWRREFADEKLFGLFDRAGFLDLLALLPSDCRGTHPNKRWGDSALDYIFARGFASVGPLRLEPNEELSDHFAFLVRITTAVVR